MCKYQSLSHTGMHVHASVEVFFVALTSPRFRWRHNPKWPQLLSFGMRSTYGTPSFPRTPSTFGLPSKCPEIIWSPLVSGVLKYNWFIKLILKILKIKKIINLAAAAAILDHGAAILDHGVIGIKAIKSLPRHARSCQYTKVDFSHPRKTRFSRLN